MSTESSEDNFASADEGSADEVELFEPFQANTVNVHITDASSNIPDLLSTSIKPVCSSNTLDLGSDKITKCQTNFKTQTEEIINQKISNNEFEIQSLQDVAFGDKKKTTPNINETDGWDIEDWDCEDDQEDNKISDLSINDCKSETNENEENTSSTVTSDYISGQTWTAPDNLPTVAASWVKNMGEGLASFMDNFNLSNLSTQHSKQTIIDQPEQLNKGECDTTKPPISSDNVQSTNDGWNWDLSSIAKSLSSTVENTGMQILHGGVDVLEVIGRKTFTALKENDPGLAYTKRFLRGSEMPKLSQVLREANQQACNQSDLFLNKYSPVDQRKADIAYQLEVRHALVHLEALELLSTRASTRLNLKIDHLQTASMSGDNKTVDNLQISSLINEDGLLDKISNSFRLLDSDIVEDQDLTRALLPLNHITSGAILETVYENEFKKIEDTIKLSIEEIFINVISSLAETNTAVLKYLHKLSECLLSRPERVDNRFLDVSVNIASFVNTTKLLNERLCSTHVAHIKQNYMQISSQSQPTGVNAKRIVADLFMETGTANKYIGDASEYLIPIIHLACVNSFFPEENSFSNKLLTR